MRWTTMILALALAAPVAAPGAAQTKTFHALSLLDAPKYKAGFTQLDYVNVNAPKGGDLRLSTTGSFDNLNPYIIKGEPAPGIGYVYESLLTSPMDDVEGEYGLIAESIEVPDDLSFVVFNLNPAARWHDGTPITAEDVVWSFNTLREKGQPLYRFYYANVDKAEAQGPRKVMFHFSGPKNRELPQIMGQLPVLPKHWWASRDFEKTTLEAPLGSGPYKVAAVEAGKSIAFERVADWWGKDLPINRGRYNFNRIRYDSYRDLSVSMEAFKAGQYDFRMENSAQRWATAYEFPAMAAGKAVKAEIPHQRPAGMQAFVFNARKPKFADARVRQALGHAYDFEWTSKTLQYNAYQRTRSYFQNSVFAATALPDAAELKILEPLRAQVPPEVFTKVYAPPATDGSGNIRDGLRTATALLRDAGWTVKDQKLTGPKGEPMEIEFLLAQADFERLIQPMVRNLERLGVKGTIRTVDPAQYQNRVRSYDFDVIVGGWGQSNSPGNEQREYFSSAAADRQGGRNTAGIKNPAIDSLIDTLIAAPDRASLVVATRALDRVLQWNHYVIPMFYGDKDRLAYWNKFGRAAKDPSYGPDMMSWWVDPAKEAALK